MKIQEANTREQISSCFSVMHELRPHLSLNSFLESVARMKMEGYRLIFVSDPEDCQYLELDSGVKRLDAHRFYETNGMQKAAFHFSIPATAEKPWIAQP